MKNPATERNELSDKELKHYIKAIPMRRRVEEDQITYGVFLKDKLLISTAIKHGITNQLFGEIKKNAPFDDKQWAVFLNLNVRTLQRYRQDKGHVFKPIISEKIFELAEVISLGIEIFDSMDDFRIWLMTPSVALGKEKPINLLDNSYGIDMVIAELNRIEHGVFV